MRKILKKTALISILTFSSRVLGVVRDTVIAMVFGTSAQSDAFFIAFRPFDLVRKLFSEGVLGVSFIPAFSKTLDQQGKSSAIAMLFSFFCLLSVAAIIIMFAGLVFAPYVVKIIAPGFVSLSYKYNLTILLFKIMLPYFWFILITGLSMGVLNSMGNFGAPAAAPVVFNIGMILFVLFITSCFKVPVLALAIGVTIGGVLQLAIQIPFMVRLGILKPTQFKIFNPQSLKIFKIMVPTMIGAASYQVNIMVASFFASTLEEGSVSYLYYADRLVQFPLALFGVSVATVFLPDLSKKANSGELSDMGALFSNGVIMVFFVTIPAMAGLMAMNKLIIAFLFGHGAFDTFAVKQTADCLFFLVTGLWAFTGVRLFVTLYYAMSKVRLPFYSGLITIGLNLVLCSVLVKYLELRGLVLSVAFSAMAGCLFLFINLPSSFKVDKFLIIVSACRSLFLSVIMFFLVRLATGFVLVDGVNKFSSGMGLVGCVFLGIVFYFGANYLISSPELKMLTKGLSKNKQ